MLGGAVQYRLDSAAVAKVAEGTGFGTANKHPDVVVKYLKAECEAIDYWNQHGKDAAGLIAKELNLTVEETEKEMKGTYMIPCGKQLTADYLGTPAQKGKFAQTLVATAEFLKSTYGIVPAGAESDFIDFEGELDDMLWQA